MLWYALKIYIQIQLLSKNKCSVKILISDIKSEFIKIVNNLLRSKVDLFSHCYLHVNCQYRENVVIRKYIFINIIHVSIISHYNIKSLILRLITL